MRGFNESDKPTYGYDLTTLAGDIAGLIHHLGGKAHVVGRDWGGAVAYQLAMDSPRKVDKLAILNAPHPDVWIESWLTHPEQQRMSWYVFFNLLPDLPEALYKEQFDAGTIRLAKVMHPDALDVYRRAFNKPGVATAAVNYYREIVRDIERRRRQKPKRITRPVRVLWGAEDVALDPIVNEIAARWCDDFDVT
jgi:pimeloyl-ACP methyl ester carboxylesterase